MNTILKNKGNQIYNFLKNKKEISFFSEKYNKIYNYKLNKTPIGKGAFGKVYSCNKDTCENFAFKIITKGDTLLIKNELDVLNKIIDSNDNNCHKYILCIKDYGYSGDHPNTLNSGKIVYLRNPNNLSEINPYYIIYEYLDGYKELTYFNNNNKDIIIDMMYQLIEGLLYMHTLGISHRDIKPENIMFKIEGNNVYIKYIDFGFACINCNGRSGTEIYAHPFLFIKNKTINYNYCDYFSLLVTFIYMIDRNNFNTYTNNMNEKNIINKKMILLDNMENIFSSFFNDIINDKKELIKYFILKIVYNIIHNNEENINIIIGKTEENISENKENISENKENISENIGGNKRLKRKTSKRKIYKKKVVKNKTRKGKNKD